MHISSGKMNNWAPPHWLLLRPEQRTLEYSQRLSEMVGRSAPKLGSVELRCIVSWLEQGVSLLNEEREKREWWMRSLLTDFLKISSATQPLKIIWLWILSVRSGRHLCLHHSGLVGPVQSHMSTLGKASLIFGLTKLTFELLRTRFDRWSLHLKFIFDLWVISGASAERTRSLPRALRALSFRVR